MSNLFSPANDPTLLNLKKIAQGGGDRGPLYDQGVLAVVGQVEREGSYIPDRMAGLLCLMGTQNQINSRLLTDEELAEGQQFLSQRGWTLEQGIQYMSGVEFAEKMMLHLRRKEDGQ